MSSENFRIGDKVFYTGTRFRDRLNGKPGWIHAPVVNSPGVWVCEFLDTRGKDQSDSDDYVMPERVLTKRHHVAPAEKKHEGPEVQPRRRKKDPEEE